ncbi:undecaprenyl-phosphate glucose phosphotransferase [Halioxenophilus aromaticivorans]|uniref:Undecaprenyl-phosphate glucose phosphotransferase n=1 Tax=Halioxenophilus aromaticivorans TaxID=1306992 RepID=A0AAV3U7Y6_9ALTE
MALGARGSVKPHSSLFALFSRVTDCALVIAGVVITASQALDTVPQSYFIAALGAVICLQFSAEFAEIYRSWRSETIWAEARQVSFCWIASFTFIMAVGSVTHLEESLFSWPQFALWFACTWLMLLAWRVILRVVLQAVRDRGYNTRSVAIVGNGELALDVAHRIQNCSWGGYTVQGFYDDRQAPEQPVIGDQKPRALHGQAGVCQISGNFNDLIRDARAGVIDQVYVTIPMRGEQRIQWLTKRLAESATSVYIIPDVFMFDLLHARTINLNGIPAIGVVGEPNRGTMSMLKRMEDLVIALCILALISGPMLLIAAAVKLTSKGPVFFRQTRYGLDGKPFKMWKFRSMSVCEDSTDQIQQAQRNDSRITRVGGFLRKTSLDELPQFFNVLEGTMSIVGPRPHAVAHNELYREQIFGYMLRHKIKPGITGWAQINGARGETDTLDKMERRVEYDLQYIRHWSILWDLKIIFLTIFKGFVGKNAF